MNRLSLAPGIVVASRSVRDGDENLLTARELDSLPGCILPVRQRAAAARTAARDLLSDMKHPDWELPRRVGQGPAWPEGIVGSLSHCDDRVAAAVASAATHASVGVDIEPAEPLPPETLSLVATPDEVRAIRDDPIRGRLLFCAKEAAYKAAFTLDAHVLEPLQIEVDLGSRIAKMSYGRTVTLSFHTGRYLIALGFVSRRNGAAIPRMASRSSAVR